MATTSSTLVAGKALASQGGNGDNGRFGLKAKLAAGIAVLGCAGALVFGGLKTADSATPQAQPAVAPANVALAQALAGNGYLEFSPGEAVTIADPARSARTRALAGAGFLEFQPGEGPVVGTSASSAVAGVGLREYLDGEGPVVSLPLSSPTIQPAPQLGPQP